VATPSSNARDLRAPRPSAVRMGRTPAGRGARGRRPRVDPRPPPPRPRPSLALPFIFSHSSGRRSTRLKTKATAAEDQSTCQDEAGDEGSDGASSTILGRLPAPIRLPPLASSQAHRPLPSFARPFATAELLIDPAHATGVAAAKRKVDGACCRSPATQPLALRGCI
jgi:hypothetical protein